jgi:ComF family protein
MKNNKNTFLQKIKDLLLNIFFPEMCISCGEAGQSLCSKCLSEIKNQKSEDNYKNIDWIHSCLSYKNPKLKNALFYLKYHYTKSIAKHLAGITYQDFYIFLEKIDPELKNVLILPIPISKKRLRERNYNQSELIIREIISKIKENKNLNLENFLIIDLILKNKDTIKFAKTHSHTERENLIRDAFLINDKYKNKFLEDKKIILIDDITTTGATFYEARNALIKAGFQKKNIFGFAVAH